MLAVATASLPRKAFAWTHGTGSVVAPYLASAQKIVAINTSPRTLTSSALSIDTSNTGNSTISGRTLLAGGEVATASVPNGYSGPLNANSKWIVSKNPNVQTATNLAEAPGNSKLFKFSGQKFDFKGSILSGNSFSIRWSTNNGLTWKQSPATVVTQTCWCLIDFGSSLGANGVVEVIGENELFEIFGFDFDTGPSAPAAFTDTALPLGMMLGDSYVFSQGSRQDPSPLNQQATLGMCRKAAQTIGSLQIYNDGLRTNGFSNTQSGVQSKYADRITLPSPADPTLSEGPLWGVLDYVIIPWSINDSSSAYDGVRQADVTAAFQNIRSAQPTALIVFPIGMQPPDETETANFVNTCINGFKAVFGNSSSNWIANGAYLLNGSRLNGANWIPAGAVGSSPYFPNTVDTTVAAHPNPDGHAFAGNLYGQQVVDLATSIVNL